MDPTILRKILISASEPTTHQNKTSTQYNSITNHVRLSLQILWQLFYELKT